MEENGNIREQPEKAPEADSGKEGFSLKQEVFGWVECIVISVLAVAVVITFLGRIVMVDGISMVPTLHDQERIITTPLFSGFERGDVVVIRRKGDTPLVKRVVGLPGETVDVDYEASRVLIDGEPVEEPYLAEEMYPTFYQSIELPVRVPEGSLFVMGDNRNHSSDSRSPNIGLIDTRNVFGKAVCRVWPLDKISAVG